MSNETTNASAYDVLPTQDNVSRLLSRWYQNELNDSLESLKLDIENGYVTDDNDSLDEWLWDHVDSCVTHTFTCQLIIAASNNDDAASVHGYDVTDDGAVDWSRMAFFAYMEDLREHIDWATRMGKLVIPSQDDEGNEDDEEGDDNE